jgi:hypothetical protein
MQRIFTFGVLAAALLAPLAGCGGATTEGRVLAIRSVRPSASPTPKPYQVVDNASAKLNGQNLKFSLSTGTADPPVTGSLDATTGHVSLSVVADGNKLNFVVTGEHMYLGSPASKGRWVRFDVAKLSAESGMLVVAEPLFGRGLLVGSRDVKQAAPGHFVGVIDLFKTPRDTGSAASRLAEHLETAVGENEVAFTAVVDAQGRLSEFQATFPGAAHGADMVYDFKILEVGMPVTVTVPPKSKVVEAPASAYKDLAGP